MTAEEIALAQLAVARAQTWVTGLAIFMGPLVGILFARWDQRRRDKRKDKEFLFLTLLVERKGVAYSEAAVRAMNSIDIVFADRPKIVELWHTYYALLNLQATTVVEARSHAWLKLLTEMARELGYKKLEMTDLDKFYFPQGHADRLELHRQMELAFLQFLQTMSQTKGVFAAENDRES